MTEATRKEELKLYLQRGRDAVVWKLEGLSEYDVRRPLVPTGTNLLGLIKHLTMVEAGYFGDTFGRPFAEALVAWDELEETPNADMWAKSDESRDDITGLYRKVREHADRTIDELDLDAEGTVPWWPEERRRTTLHRILIHVAVETHRHAGHADIVRELIDSAAGVHPDYSNLPDADRAWWESYRNKLEQVAREAGGRSD
jgi:uncharacterized damage-inducible protein DinB